MAMANRVTSLTQSIRLSLVKVPTYTYNPTLSPEENILRSILSLEAAGSEVPVDSKKIEEMAKKMEK